MATRFPHHVRCWGAVVFVSLLMACAEGGGPGAGRSFDLSDASASGDLTTTEDGSIPFDVSGDVDGFGAQCQTIEDCSDGLLCLDGACARCDGDQSCTDDYGAVAACRAGLCVACPRGRDGCQCDDMACDDGLVCVEGSCRAPESCAELQCGPFRLCNTETLECLNECEGERVFDSESQTCVIPGANCVSGAPGSITEDCAAEKRRCESNDSGAECGACLVGYTEESGFCRPVRTCSLLGCDDDHRVCLPEGPFTDAGCGRCKSGYAEDGDECVLASQATYGGAGE
ncbi:MAG: hypothetical protein KC561_06300, partial [Myxococcales bacterium]|nr:hypothetical protein [Myxococcales bacterium]